MKNKKNNNINFLNMYLLFTLHGVPVTQLIKLHLIYNKILNKQSEQLHKNINLFIF